MSPQKLIQESKTIGIALGLKSQSRDIADALMLFAVLSKLGKNVYFEKEGGVPDAFSWVDIPSLSAKTTVLTIKEVAPLVSKISYEKNERDLRFSLTLKEGALNLNRIELERTPETDLTLIVGENMPQDNSEATFNPHPRLWNPRKAFEAGLALLSPFHIPPLRLLQRTLLKLEYITAKNLCIAPLEKRDFRETQTNARDVRTVIEELAKWGRFYSSYLILFQSLSLKEKIQGLLWTNKKELREKISNSLKAVERGNWALFQSPEKELQKTKEKILSLL